MSRKEINSQFTFNLLVSNKPGVLGRISLVFSRRGYNIESLAVNHTLDRKFSRLTITTEGSPHLIEDIIKQVRKIIDVIAAQWSLGSTENETQHGTLYDLSMKSQQSKAVILNLLDESPFEIVDFSDNALLIRGPQPTGETHIFMEMLKHYSHVKQNLNDFQSTHLGDVL